MKKALITGITGQDGSYLAELLIEKGYEVHGIKRRSSMFNTQRIDHIYKDPHYSGSPLYLHYSDLTDTLSLNRLIENISPDEIYNLGAQSHVAVSFEMPEYTSDVNALGTLRILECIKTLGLKDKTKFYQASSSELFGMVTENPQNENTPFYPRSPYAVAKLYSYWITINYREAYNIFACNGILFNHESPRRGETFVTRKITRGLSNIALGIETCLFLGNLDASRDWGHAKDYVRMQWLMLQQEKPEDYVISMGEQHTVREFLALAASHLGIGLDFEGSGAEEVARVREVDKSIAPYLKVGQIIARVDQKYYRPTEVDSLLGDSRKASKFLGWQPNFSLDKLIKDMIDSDYSKARGQKMLLEEGFYSPYLKS